MNKIDWQTQLGVEIITLPDATKIIGDSDDYYVYIIWKMYEDPPIPFYVGKGHWQRLGKHEMKSEENNNIYKTNIIKKHSNLGIKCGYSIFDFFENEQDALEQEVELISLIGRADLKVGTLANKTDGGDGTLGHLALKGGDSHSAKPVIADNKYYPCLTDASIALNVTLGAIAVRIKHGWEGYYYEDIGQQSQTKSILGRYRKPAIVEGRQFISVSDAARELGLNVGMICKRIKYGWDGYYYLDQGQLPRRAKWDDRKDKVAVRIKGTTYDTVSEASKITGETVAKISKRSLSSNYPDYQRLDRKIVEKQAPPRKPLEVVIHNHIFESVGEAAKFHGMTRGGIQARCSSSNFPEYKFCDAKVQKHREVKSEFSSNPINVEIDGIKFESQSAAARAHKIDTNTAKKRFRSYSFPNWICHTIAKQKPRDGRLGMIGVEINGIIYRSVSAASANTGEPRNTIKKKAISEKYQHYRLLTKPH